MMSLISRRNLQAHSWRRDIACGTLTTARPASTSSLQRRRIWLFWIWILPKKDGFKVLREMKWREDTKDVPVIVLSNLENSDNIELAIRLGAKSYLAKSNYSIANIVEKIQGTFGGK